MTKLRVRNVGGDLYWLLHNAALSGVSIPMVYCCGSEAHRPILIVALQTSGGPQPLAVEELEIEREEGTAVPGDIIHCFFTVKKETETTFQLTGTLDRVLGLSQ